MPGIIILLHVEFESIVYHWNAPSQCVSSSDPFPVRSDTSLPTRGSCAECGDRDRQDRMSVLAGLPPTPSPPVRASLPP